MYRGIQPFSGDPLADKFIGDGVTTTFTLSRTPGSENAVTVSVGGALLIPGYGYSISGNRITFAFAPPAANSGTQPNILVSHLGVSGLTNTPASGSVTYNMLSSALQQSFSQAIIPTEFIATVAQTTFTITPSYTPGALMVFKNGAKLKPGVDYVASNGTTVVLNTACSAGDEVTVVQFNTFSVANAYTIAQVDSAIQNPGARSYAADTSNTANLITINLSPAITALTDGLVISTQVKNTNTGATQITVNGLGPYSIVGGAHQALTGGELVATGKAQMMWHSSLNSFVLLDSTGGYQTSSTAPQFDNSQKVATTEFVQRALGNYSGYFLFNSSQTLTAVHAGAYIKFIIAPACTCTLPSLQAGVKFTITNAITSGQALTVNIPGGVGSVLGSGNQTTFVMQPGTEAQFVSIGGGSYEVIDGSGSSVLTTNGYQRLPSGLIIQWGNGIVTSASGVGNYSLAVTFPIAFPNNYLSITQGIYGSDPASNGFWATIQTQGASKTGFTSIIYKGTSNGAWETTFTAIGY
jgi:hypothetical protein